jgi:predicted SAM-dependent methyltransferase
MEAKLLNLGCGARFHPAWTNLDLVSSSPHVIACDLRRGIPCPEAAFDLVYHSHVLEHIPRPSAGHFIGECARVLRKGGILRVVVPDLETIARLYLEKLEHALQGSNREKADYDWMVIELLDQLARTQNGGEALEYLTANDIPNESFVLSRWGVEAKKIIDRSRPQNPKSHATSPSKSKAPPSLFHRLARLARSPRQALRSCREALLKRALGSEWPLLELGRFRAGGSIHQWMYDRFSLAELLKAHGFTRVAQRSATESFFADWSQFNLDTEPDGSVYKPDSLFVEGIKA